MRIYLNFLILIASIQVIHATESSLDAQRIFKESINVFSMPTIHFIVDAEINERGNKETRSFMIAKQTQNIDNYTLLMRFLSPMDIKCTAILINHTPKGMYRYAYFPSLNRVRMIPQQDSSKEILGMGISYDDLSDQKKNFSKAELITENNQKYYKLTQRTDYTHTIYYIGQHSRLLHKIEFFEQQHLTKRVLMMDTLEYQKQTMIKTWCIEDLKNTKTITFKIREKSVSDKINKQLFQKTKLDRCLF